MPQPEKAGAIVMVVTSDRRTGECTVDPLSATGQKRSRLAPVGDGHRAGRGDHRQGTLARSSRLAPLTQRTLWRHASMRWRIGPALAGPALPACRASRQDVCDCPAGADCATAPQAPTMAWQRKSSQPRQRLPAHTRLLHRHRPNVTVLTGKRSNGLCVGDVDRRSGGSLEALWSRGWPQNTPIEQTGNGWLLRPRQRSTQPTELSVGT